MRMPLLAALILVVVTAGALALANRALTIYEGAATPSKLQAEAAYCIEQGNSYAQCVAASVR